MVCGPVGYFAVTSISATVDKIAKVINARRFSSLFSPVLNFKK
ncbi:Uncharacterised protein [Staphylococcus saccharolyticus]|uniref:Uncharacterized protein n=1 Tax=Staphylococcus saccharolyticus TaxID=33028 RepID=A0A380HAY7_9STAP|nr:Uncharacterised protein [Staphylococcus saccharolyticus]